MTEIWRQRLAAHPLALGGAPLGNLFSPVSDDAAIALVRHAFTAGVRYFDTAPHYGNGLSERRFGAALRQLPRESFLLSTKVGRLLHDDPHAPSQQHGYVDLPPSRQAVDYTRDGVLRSLDASRARLGIERVDLVYIHDLDQATHGDAFDAHFRDLLDGGLPALAQLKAEGAIAAYGIGVNGVSICLETLAHADLDIILLAGRYTLADQSALPELLPACLRRKVAVVMGGVFNSGILATGTVPVDGAPPRFDYAPASPEVVKRVGALEATCREFGVPLQAAALAYSRRHPAVVALLIGARSVAEFDQSLAMVRQPIAPSFWTALAERGLIALDAPQP